MYTEGCGVIFPYSLTIKTACTSCWYLWSYFRCGNFRSLMEVIDSLIVKTKLAKSNWKPTFTSFTSHLVFIFFSQQKMKTLAERRRSAPSLILDKALQKRPSTRWVQGFTCTAPPCWGLCVTDEVVRSSFCGSEGCLSAPTFSAWW